MKRRIARKRRKKRSNRSVTNVIRAATSVVVPTIGIGITTVTTVTRANPKDRVNRKPRVTVKRRKARQVQSQRRNNVLRDSNVHRAKANDVLPIVIGIIGMEITIRIATRVTGARVTIAIRTVTRAVAIGVVSVPKEIGRADHNRSSQEMRMPFQPTSSLPRLYQSRNHLRSTLISMNRHQ